MELSREDFRRWGSTGGKISHRHLSSADARRMAKVSALVRGGKQRSSVGTRVPLSKSVHGTQEWAAHNMNLQVGCEHNCKYCYAKCMAIRFKRSTTGGWQNPRISADKIGRTEGKKDGRIMFPTSHDITPFNIEVAARFLLGLLDAGNEVLVVSKPHLSCVRHLCEMLQDYRQRLLFRFTIGSADNRVLKFWEPNAPDFEERLSALRWAYDHGFRTSVSSEPMLDTRIDKVVVAVKPFVTDAVWLGRVNRLRSALAINCPQDRIALEHANRLLAAQSDSWIESLYRRYQMDLLIKWKDSIKKVVGLQRPVVKGLDL